MQHFNGIFNKAGLGKGGADVFFGSATAGIDRVQIHFAIIKDIACHHGALQKMDIVQPIRNAGGVVQIL